MLAHCPACGRPVAPNARACPGCGKPTALAQQSTNAAAIMLLCVVGTFVVWGLFTFC